MHERDAEAKEGAWTLLRLVGGRTEGDIIRGLLESHGIPVMIAQEAIGRIYALTVDGLGAIRVMVPAGMKDEARRILEEAERESGK